jgi:hypothetical protein
MRLLSLLLSTILLLQLGMQPTHAAESIVIRNVTRFATITLRPNATLKGIMANTNERIYLENVERHNTIGRVAAPPAALTTIMANINERIYLENVERHSTIGRVAVPPAALTTIMANINERIYLENIEKHQAFPLYQLILDNGVPTGTVARNGAVGTPTSTIQSRRQVTVTPTTVPTDMPQSVTPMADKGTPSSTVVIESTPEPSVTPTVTP